MKKIITILFAILIASTTRAHAIETPIGEPVERNGMEIAAVYLQPIVMEPEGIYLPREKSDIHLEADIHATRKNPNGFGAGEWIPYLKITYTIINLDTVKKISGELLPMVASDGPHYGANVKMMGIGNYRLIYRIEPPVVNGFGRHTDRETGVAPWWEPFEVEWTFQYFGPGKKGGY